ncbi:MAG: coproporphyrinogen III oxidase family protein [Phycisphaerae bacterium]|nr:coproporphyrinogen III oxidase family protein [Phycisphaerae bacterium]MCZ2398540.1 coproporphyrinogen III oxidase family protein [Phycisphaerae bacterium]NUQ50294.1 coproporphyrinogen III oxidase family protein [Phycisphaerae bacterium]
MQLDVLKETAKTEPGSYFVANYPPFSAWKPEHVSTALAALEGRSDVAGSVADGAAPLGLYLHIPFCRKRCKFCYFRVYTDKNSGDVDIYMDGLAREIALYKRCAALDGREFEFVYFGGGTPSFLSNDQLQRLIERINEHWRWDAAREVTFECEPGTLKLSKLRTIRRIGVTRLSLGIEHWDDDILEQNGRAHRSAEIGAAYAWAREVGFAQINVDLIAGMVGDDEAKWKLAVERTLALAPDSLTIYQMELPYNTEFTREQRQGGAVAVADWATKRRWVDYAFGQFEAAGYSVSSAYTLVKGAAADAAQRFVYRDSLWHGADMIGTGVASFSHLAGVHYQNLDQWERYLDACRAGELPLARALPISHDQRLIRELVLQLKLGRADADYFRRKFGVDIRERFADAWRSLEQEGYATAEDEGHRLTRGGLLRVDALLPRFFEPQFRDVRYT